MVRAYLDIKEVFDRVMNISSAWAEVATKLYSFGLHSGLIVEVLQELLIYLFIY